jgi:hypothetical protein
VVAGSAPTVTSTVMTVPAGTALTFGSPAWGAINTWQVRWQYASGLSALFYLHYVDANDRLQVAASGTSLALAQVVAGTTQQLASATVTRTGGAWYWLKVTQFPTVPGDPPDVQATLYNDNTGAMGSQVPALGPVPTYDAVTALSGKAGCAASGAALAVGGTFAGVQTIALFGPGGWPSVPQFGTGIVTGAWEQNSANTYGGGPVTSFGALRMDFPTAGTASAGWGVYNGGATAGTSAIPVAAAGNVLGVAAVAHSAGLGANAVVTLQIDEYDANGSCLRNGNVSSKTAAAVNAGWVTHSGTYTTGANCAYAGIFLFAADTSAPGASASATVWFDNVQVWNHLAPIRLCQPIHGRIQAPLG